MKKITLLPFLACLLLFLGCSSLKSGKSQTELDNMVSMMIGSFNSAAQAKKDSTYYDITLHMYPIWVNQKSNKKYLYVEQTVTSMPDKPYRQRVYEVSQIGNIQLKSVIYKIPDEKSYIGKWTTPAYFNKISPADLQIREGCAVFMNKVANNNYKGSTNEKDCKSTLRGATYATSVVEIQKGKVLSWDQGFNDKDEQVWGAVKAGYEFIKYQ